MGLKETIKETKEKLDAAVEVETKAEETALEALNAVVEKTIEEPVKEAPKEEVKDETPKEEIKADDKEKTPSEHREERIAKKKEKDRLAEELAVARERIAALEANFKPEPKTAPLDYEPDIQTQPLEWTAWKIRKQEEKIEKLSGWKAEQDVVKQREDLRMRAINEVAAYENQLRTTAPDYDAVKEHYSRVLAASIKIVNPNITNQQLAEAVNNRLLTRASELLNQGYENPIEAMYLEAKSLGFKPKEEAVEEVKPDLDKVSSLRKRNAGMAAASGGGNADSHVSPSIAAKMTNAEFAKLKPEQKKRLFAQLAGG